jgi:transposase
LHLIRLFSILRTRQSPIFRASPHEAGIRSCIPPKSQSQDQNPLEQALYRERNRIERMIGRVKINRAIAAR